MPHTVNRFLTLLPVRLTVLIQMSQSHTKCVSGLDQPSFAKSEHRSGVGRGTQSIRFSFSLCRFPRQPEEDYRRPHTHWIIYRTATTSIAHSKCTNILVDQRSKVGTGSWEGSGRFPISDKDIDDRSRLYGGMETKRHITSHPYQDSIRFRYRHSFYFWLTEKPTKIWKKYPTYRTKNVRHIEFAIFNFGTLNTGIYSEFWCCTGETQLDTRSCGIEGLPSIIVGDTSEGLEPK